jgi:hypothetical protein
MQVLIFQSNIYRADDAVSGFNRPVKINEVLELINPFTTYN